MAEKPDMNIKIGRLLQAAREQKGVFQSDMAEYIGLTKNHISALERGINKASIDVLLGYCSKLDMTPNEILGYEKDEILIPELKEILSITTAAQQQRIIQMIKLMTEK